MKKKYPTIFYVVDSLGWVQAARYHVFRSHLPEYCLKMISLRQLLRWPFRFRFKKYPLYFSNWRMVRAHPEIAELFDLGRSLASVTSHYQLGGGLNDKFCFPKGTSFAEEKKRSLECLKKFKVVTTNSRILYRLLRSHRQVLYTPNGVDTTFFLPRPIFYDEPLRIGWVGRMKAAKNYDITLKPAFAGLTELGYEIRQVQVTREGDNILSREQMRQFYQDIHFYLCASWHEGTPNPALEAAACGVPVVTTWVGNMPELIRDGENGFLIEPTVESILSCFARIRGFNNERYQKFRQNIRLGIEKNWDWKIQIQNYRKVFEALLS